jgi:fluoride exporter
VVIVLAVGVAGAFGAVARYLTDGFVQDRTSGPFPYGTLTVNVIGSFIIGIAEGLWIHSGGSSQLRTIVGAGFCGGLTTWSTVSWELVRLFDQGSHRTAVGFGLTNLFASLAAAALGLVVVGAW